MDGACLETLVLGPSPSATFDYRLRGMQAQVHWVQRFAICACGEREQSILAHVQAKRIVALDVFKRFLMHAAGPATQPTAVYELGPEDLPLSDALLTDLTDVKSKRPAAFTAAIAQGSAALGAALPEVISAARQRLCAAAPGMVSRGDALSRARVL